MMLPVSSRNPTTAYALFLIAGLAPLAIGIANVLPMSTGTAGGVGLLVLVPLTVASFAAMVAAIIRTVRLGGPRSLVVLSLLCVSYVAAFFTADSDLLPGWLRRFLPLALGLVIVATALYGLIAARRARPDGSR